MAYVTENNYTGNGSTVLYSFTFPYLETTDIKVTVADAARAQGSGSDEWTLPNATQIQFNTAPTNGQAIKIYRDTDIDNLKAEFFAGSAIRSQDLNEDFLQNLYNSQEAEAAIVDKWEKGLQTLDSSEAFVDSDDKIMTAAAIDDRINANIAVQPLADTKILVGNGSGVATAVNVSGDATIANTGAVTIANNAINADKLANTSVDTNAIQDANVTLDKIEAVASTKIIVGNSSNRPAAVTMSGDATLSNTGALSLAADSVDTNEIADDAVEAAQLAGSAVVNDSISPTAAIAHSKLQAVPDGQIIVGSGSTVPTAVAISGDVTLANDGAVTIANDAVEIGMIGCEQTTISDSDSHIPTSGAVVDYVTAQLAATGGITLIADEDNFPAVQPTSGLVISIKSVDGIVINGSGVCTTARTAGNGSDNVTINGFPSDLYSKTLSGSLGLMVSSTGSGNIYTYHKLLAKESDVEQLSQDINDFGNRYRVADNEGALTGTDDEGDLFFDKDANKMKVYDGSSWGEVTSTGEFKYLVMTNPGTTDAATLTNSTFDLKETSTSGSAASVTNAAQLIVSINGVIQKPNTGTSAPAEGFALSDTDTIVFGGAPGAGSSVFIIQIGSAVSIPTPGDDTVTSAKIVDGAIVNADINASANIAGSKIADDSITEAKLDIHAAPTGTDKFLKYTSNGMEWVVPTDTNTQLSTEEVQDIAGPLVATGGTKTGITVTYDDTNGDMDFVVDDATKLPLAGGTITGDVVFDNATNSGHDVTWDMSDSALEFADNVKATFGADGDLAIVHTGSNSDITDSGGGDLRLIASTLKILNAAASETCAIFTQNAGVELYYDNTKEFETKLGGVKLYGHSECAVNDLGSVNTDPTFDFTVANYITMTLTGNVTVQNPTTESVGQSGSIIITQDGTGSRTCAWSSQFKWTGGTAPTLTTTAGAVDRIDYLVVAADTIHCVASLDVK